MPAEADKIVKLEKRFRRERTARKEAETLLEAKSLELYESNIELQALANNLEKIVEKRTHELEQEKNRALELSLAKSRFVATMSHEIRTPINGVMGALNLLESEPLNDTCKNLIEIAQHSSEVLLHVINDILDFSKIEAGQMEIEHYAFDLHKKLEDVVAHFRLANARSAVKIELSYADDIADCIFGDLLRLTQVLNNYLSNAIKFTDEGEVRLKVSLKAESLRFEVSDTGIGISEQGLERLFKDFSQVDASTSRQYGGTGLGLVICKKIIEMMNGQVGVESEAGIGSCFWAEIPYQPASLQDIVRSPEEAGDPKDNKSQQILLVDDNLVNRKIGEKVLQKFGHEVTLAESGQEALALLSSQTFDLIFMDCQMPGMDGFETTIAIRDAHIHTPVIALTANTSEEDREDAIRSGMNDFVSKPFQPEDIQKTIENWI